MEHHDTKPHLHNNATRSLNPTSLMGVVKFTFLATLFAMFGHAAIVHAMLCENDPYWTYWITDSLLMATVFGVGTAILE